VFQQRAACGTNATTACGRRAPAPAGVRNRPAGNRGRRRRDSRPASGAGMHRRWSSACVL